MGRPTKLTPEVQERVVEAIRQGAHRETAALIAGVDVRTLFRWLAKDKSPYCHFRQDVKRAEAVWEMEQVRAIREVDEILASND